MKKRNMIAVLLGIMMGALPVTAGAAALHTTPSYDDCGSQAICDVSAELQKLKDANQANRFQMIKNYRAIAQKSKAADGATLKNVLEFANKAVDLLKQLQEEDWLIREAQNLADDCLLGLAKYSELRPDQISSYYQQLHGESPRYEIITYWKAKIDGVEDTASLIKLSALFKAFAQISTADSDPDYLVRETQNAQDIISQRIVEIDPAFEGVYDIKAFYPQSMGSARLDVDRLVIMNTLGSDGIQIALVNHESGLVYYTFANAIVSDAGASLEAAGPVDGPVAKIHLSLDRAGKKVTGWLKNSDSLASLQIDGSLLVTPAEVFEGQARHPNTAPLSPQALNQAFRGKMDGATDFTLVLRSVDDQLIGATLVLDNVPHQPIQFQAVHVYAERGIIVLVATLSNGARLKMALFAQQTPTSFSASGMAFSTLDGSTHTVTLTPAVN